jgi:glutathione synthase/RimK-type ligase-like ATP-grasp enzyme
MTRLAYATYVGRDGHEGTDPELPLALAALAARGIDARSAAWDDPAVDWAAFDAVLVRSTWDYTTRRAEYLAWARRVADTATLMNPYDVIAANTDKVYLRDLAEADVAIVPTTWVAPGEDPHGLPDGEVVVKPSVSASGRDTLRTDDRATALAHVRQLTAAGRTAMVQPYLRAVEAEGEISLVFLGGRFSHAARKEPLLAGGVLDGATAVVPAPELVAFGESVLQATPRRDDLVYARVDVVSVGGQPLLMELELTEPYLYLDLAAHAADRLAAAVERVVGAVKR